MNGDLSTTDVHHTLGKRLVVVLATKDEVASIGAVLSEIREAAEVLGRLVRTSIVLVDDSGTHHTRGTARSWASALGLEVEVIDGPGSGLGAAVVCGMRHALRRFDDVGMVANLDADGQHDARELPTLVRSFLGRSLDVMVGSRWVRGGRSFGTSTFRTVGSNAGNLAFRVMTGVRGIKDATSSFRVYSPAAVAHVVKNAEGYPRGYAFFSTIIADLDSAGMTLGEVPITFRPRYAGQSKLTSGEVRAFFSSLPRQREIRVRPFANDPLPAYRAHEELESLSKSRRWNDWILDELTNRDLDDAPDGSILEVGAGNGAFGALLRSRWPNARLLSIEPDATNFQALAARAAPDDHWDVFHGTLAEWVEGAGRVETYARAYYVSVLEHVQNPAAELEVLKSRLAAGGRVFVFVPAGERLYGPIDRKSGHYRRYTDRSLRELVEATGMRVDDVRYLDRIGVLPYWMMYRLMLRSSISAGSVQLFDNVYVPAARALDGFIPDFVPGKNVVLHATC